MHELGIFVLMVELLVGGKEHKIEEGYTFRFNFDILELKLRLGPSLFSLIREFSALPRVTLLQFPHQ